MKRGRGKGGKDSKRSAVAEFEREGLRVLDEAVNVTDAAIFSDWRARDVGTRRDDRGTGIAEGVRLLRERLGDERLREIAATTFFEPGDLAERLRDPNSDSVVGEHRVFEALRRLAGSCMFAVPPADLHERVEHRLREAVALGDPWRGRWDAPDARLCVALLRWAPATEENLELAERVVRGEIQLPYAEDLHHLLHEQGRLTYDIFVSALEARPERLDLELNRGGIHVDGFPEGYGESFSSHHRRFVREFVAEPLDRPFSHYKALAWVEMSRLRRPPAPDSGWALASARILQHADDPRRVPRDPPEEEQQRRRYRRDIVPTARIVARKLARQASADPPKRTEGAFDLAASLGQYPREVLLELLGSVHDPDVACAVAGVLGGEWERSQPLIRVLMDGMQLRGEYGPTFGVAHSNSPDPELGVLDAPGVRRAWEAAGEEGRETVISFYRGAGYRHSLDGTLWLVRAALGDPEVAREIEKKLPKRNHQVVKALGLLPLEVQDVAGEMQRRYRIIREFQRESKQFGSQRRATEGAAAAAALANLATNAGYPDTRRLSWAMAAAEIRATPSGEETPASFGTLRSWRVGDYEAELAFDREENPALPRLIYHREERDGSRKTLKSVPKAVKESEAYPEIKQVHAEAKRDAHDLRRVLEEMMVSEDHLTAEDLTALCALPAGRFFLEGLILVGVDGGTGLFEASGSPEGHALRTPDGRVIELVAPARIAHPYHLYYAGARMLSDMQRLIVERRKAQPFKQAFRELYVLTDAEREIRTYSPRFSGHEVQTRAAASLLGSRGWYIGDSEDAVPEKEFRAACEQRSVRAVFEFEDIGHYFTEEETAATDSLGFYPLESGAGGREALPLEKVPPEVFSEAQRDADLVVSVAGTGGVLPEEATSDEVLARRAELLSALIEALGVSGITIEDGPHPRHARVQGALASYRVHLGSASVHIEPGGHLCIIPAESATKSRASRGLFLPFAAETDSDRKAREVVSKVLMLAEDQKIKDETILAQIHGASGGR